MSGWEAWTRVWEGGGCYVCVCCEFGFCGDGRSRYLSIVLGRYLRILGATNVQSCCTLSISHSAPRQNRVLKERPPPIADEEQRLNRRQRCTLSQLQSGHCHLLQDYKNRVFGEQSDICTDCGASPQDVRHLFACNTHPRDLSPEDLWRNPVGFVRSGTSTTGTLTELTTDPVVANNKIFFLPCIFLWQISQIQNVLGVVVGPGLHHPLL